VRIKWDEIPASGLLFSIDDGAWIPGKEVTCRGPGMCTVSLTKKDERVLLAGTLRLPVVLECDRCLDSFTYDLAEEFEVFFELLDKEDVAAIGSDHFCKSSELDVMYLAEPSIDVFSVLAQQMYLALPEKRLCRDTCLGLCAECGANLNSSPCGCSGGAGTSPFSVLAKLKIQ